MLRNVQDEISVVFVYEHDSEYVKCPPALNVTQTRLEEKE